MFWQKRDMRDAELITLRAECLTATYERGLAQGSMQQMGDELKELRSTNRLLLDRIASLNGSGPIFTIPQPATAADAAPVSFNQTPQDFVKEAEELERKALRDYQKQKLEELARGRALETKESAA